MTVYNIKHIPCDTALREILDDIDPVDLRPMFTTIFQKLQRGKALEKLMFMEGCYLLNLDGTGYFSSTTRHSPSCNEKVDAKTGEVTSYYMQILGAAIVHPDYKEVIPICPEPINKQDGMKKNDCERNAAKCYQWRGNFQFTFHENLLKLPRGDNSSINFSTPGIAV